MALDRLREDIRTVFENDPAARSWLEVVLSYPGLHAIWFYRFAHGLHNRGFLTLARLLSHVGRFLTGIEIHPAATIGRRVFIDHGMGVVIGETAVVGDECLLYKGVVLGGTSLEKKKRHPTLGRGVVVGSNACILGDIIIGDGAMVGSGSVVIRPVPPGATVVGVPGKVVRQKRSRDAKGPEDTFRGKLAHQDMPDPLIDLLSGWMGLLEKYEDRIRKLETDHDLPSPNLAREFRKEMSLLSMENDTGPENKNDNDETDQEQEE